MSYDALICLASGKGESVLFTQYASRDHMQSLLRKAQRQCKVRFSCRQEFAPSGEFLGVRVTLKAVAVARPSRFPSSTEEL